MAENNQKRFRGKNFSVAEEHLLVDLVEQYKSILENKRSDAVTWKGKIETWVKLAGAFASQSGEHRHWKALRDRYENLKRKSEVELAAEKRETYRTGGGPTAATTVSIISEQICSLIGESATGLTNPYDNDANNNKKLPPTKFSSKETLNVSNEKECMETTVCDDEEPTDQNDHNVSAAKWNPASLKKSVSKKLSGTKYRQKNLTLEEEKIKLTKLQQDFYHGENVRAAEKHKLEVVKLEIELKTIHLKNELLELEIEEKRRRLTL